MKSDKFKLIFIFWSGFKEERLPEATFLLESKIFKDQFKYSHKEIFYHAPTIDPDEEINFFVEKESCGTYYREEQKAKVKNLGLCPFEHWLMKYYLCCDPEHKHSSGEEEYNGIMSTIQRKGISQHRKNERNQILTFESKARVIKKTGYNFYSLIYHGEIVSGLSSDTREVSIGKLRRRALDSKSTIRQQVAADTLHPNRRLGNAVHCFIFQTNSSDAMFEDSVAEEFFKKNLDFFHRTCKTTKVDDII